MKKILSVLSICFVVLASLCLSACGENQTATSVMTMSVNPEVQFVLDQNNKVMNVTATNEDGEKLIANVNFKGKTADEASKLFVQISTELGKINVNTKGTEVTISISAKSDTAKIEELKTKVQNSVNQYFKDNGIIAGAKVVKQDIVDAINKYGKQAEDFSKKSFEEAVNYANELAEDLDKISYSMRNDVLSAIEIVKNSYKSIMDTCEKTINDMQELLKNSELPKVLKDTYTKQLNEAKKQLNETKAKIEAEIDAKVKEFQESSKAALDALKAEVDKTVTAGKKIVDTHKKAFLENKETIKKLIEDYQTQLINA